MKLLTSLPRLALVIAMLPLTQVAYAETPSDAIEAPASSSTGEDRSRLLMSNEDWLREQQRLAEQLEGEVADDADGTVDASQEAADEQPLTVIDAFNAAVVNNLRLRSAQAINRAERQATREAWSAILPQVEATASYGVSQYKRDFGIDDSFSDRDENTRYDVSLSQVLYSKRTFENINRAKANEKQADIELRSELMNTGFAAVEAFLEVQALEREVQVLANERSSHERRLRQVSQMLDRGLATRADALEARARIDEVAAEEQALRQDFNVAIQNLNAITGLEFAYQPRGFVSETLWQLTPDLLQDPWLDIARENAHEIAIARASVELADATRRSERAGHLPEFSLNARHVNNDTFATDLRKETRVEVQMRLPIYSGGGTTARSRQAAQRLEASQYDLQDAEQQTAVDVTQVMEQLGGSLARIEALNTARESALASFEIADRGFRSGVRNLNQLLDAQERVSANERRLIREVYRNLALQLELRRRAGTLDNRHVDQLMSQ